MKILFVVPYAPNPVRVRPYQFIRALLARGNQVTVASLWTSVTEKEGLEDLARQGATLLAAPIDKSRTLANLVRALPSREPLQSAWSWQPALFEQIRHALATERFDAIHVEHLRGSRYARAIQEFVAAGTAQGMPPVIWDSVDSISSLFEQARRLGTGLKTKTMTTFELPRTRRAEGELAATFPRVIVTSEGDREALVALAQARGSAQGAAARKALRVVANGVDLEDFPFAGAETRRSDRIVLSGKMSYHANAAAADLLVNRIMPLVWQSHPHTTVWLAGKDPVQAMLEWAKKDPEHIVVTGAVKSMGAILGEATIAAAPLLYGAGIQNKVLEAMACGTPVVATSIAASALRAAPGRDLEVADGAESFAAALIGLLDDPARRAAMGRAGRDYVELHHSWDAAAAQLENIYMEAAA